MNISNINDVWQSEVRHIDRLWDQNCKGWSFSKKCCDFCGELYIDKNSFVYYHGVVQCIIKKGHKLIGGRVYINKDVNINIFYKLEQTNVMKNIELIKEYWNQ